MNSTPNSSGYQKSFWDRPIVITLVGGVALTLISTLWNTLELQRQREIEYQRAIYKDIFIKQQLKLLIDLPTVFDNTGTVINNWLSHILFMAEEKNNDFPRSKTIKGWEEEVKRLQEKYENAAPLDGTLKMIQVAFACDTTRNTSESLYKHWQDFIQLHLTVNRDYNAGEKIAPAKISEYESRRQKKLAQLESAKDSLLEKMRQEMSGIRIGRFKCPT